MANFDEVHLSFRCVRHRRANEPAIRELDVSVVPRLIHYNDQISNQSKGM